MNYIEAPHEFWSGGPAVFLAGGISDCENWQAQVVRSLQHIDATVLNPRRDCFSEFNVVEKRRQIEWEHRHLQRADLVAFWFPPQTLCPIALFELGLYCATADPIVVGADPRYQRRFDLETQLALRRPHVKIADTLGLFIDQIQRHAAIRGTFP
jgi:hypothetical protein